MPNSISEDKNFLSEEEFSSGVSKISLYGGGEIESFMKSKFTTEQLTMLCTIIGDIPKMQATGFIGRPDLTEHDLITIAENGEFSDLAALLQSRVILPPKVIENCLLASNPTLRRHAYLHPSCTDAQKVVFNLKWGKPVV